jgi:hypothetical protein
MDSEPTANAVQQVFSAIASVLGLILIGFGLWALGGAIYVAWELFREPASIAQFSVYFVETTKIAAQLPGGDGPANLLSWFVVIILLLVLGKLGDWAITLGARLLNPDIRKRD